MLDEIQAKVVLLGDSGSGKSSIINYYKTGGFNLELDSTIGASFYSHTITIGRKKLKLSIWDTAGQERYDSISSLYSRNSNAVILVADCTRGEISESFKKWYLKIVKEVLPESVLIFMAVNKVDLMENISGHDEILELAKKLKAKVYFTSAKNGSGINEMFQGICKGIIDSNIDLSTTGGNIILGNEKMNESKMMKNNKKCC